MRALHPRATEISATVDAATIPTRTELSARCPVGELEGFVLSRVDGQRTVQDIAALLSLTTHEAGMVLTRLAQLGAVALTQSVELDDGWDAPSGSLPTARPNGDPGSAKD